jgi:hypothetical protein
MTETLQEYVDSRGVSLRVDRDAGVLRGVKLIGMESLNGRRYQGTALSAAVSLYEGAKVNVNHPKEGPLAPRDYRDRLGVIRQVEFRPGDGLFGNLHYNPKHALAEQLAWDAENNPRNVGFSHNVLAKLTREGGVAVVEAITHVQSVDLVADPASTQGLFEQEHTGGAAVGAAVGNPVEELASVRAELQESVAREQTLRRQLRIHEAVAKYPVLGAVSTGRELREALGGAFYAALLAAPDDDQAAALISERAAALEHAGEAKRSPTVERPRSSEPLAALLERQDRPRTSAEFARALKAGA